MKPTPVGRLTLAGGARLIANDSRRPRTTHSPRMRYGRSHLVTPGKGRSVDVESGSSIDPTALTRLALPHRLSYPPGKSCAGGVRRGTRRACHGGERRSHRPRRASRDRADGSRDSHTVPPRAAGSARVRRRFTSRNARPTWRNRRAAKRGEASTPKRGAAIVRSSANDTGLSAVTRFMKEGLYLSCKGRRIRAREKLSVRPSISVVATRYGEAGCSQCS